MEIYIEVYANLIYFFADLKIGRDLYGITANIDFHMTVIRSP